MLEPMNCGVVISNFQAPAVLRAMRGATVLLAVPPGGVTRTLTPSPRPSPDTPTAIVLPV